MLSKHIELPMDKIIAFCQRYPIRKLSLFGSVLRDDFRPESDIDILVEFEDGSPLTYLDLARIENELSRLLDRKVDLREPEELSHYFRDHVVQTALPLYERK